MGGGGGEESNSTESSCVHHLSDIKPSILEDNGVHFSILLIVLISLTIAFEILDHILMRKLRRYPHLLFAVGRIYKEIMILGLINMIVFLANQTNTLDFKIGEETFDPLLFEFVHLALFLISFIYLILALLFVIVLVRISFRYWANLDNTSSAEQATTQASFMESKVASSRLYQFNPFYRARLVLVHRTLYFNKIKQEFIEVNGLQSDKTFKFARYLRKCSRKVVVEIMEVDWKIWAFFLVLAILNTLRVKYLGHLTKGTLEGYLIFGWSVLILNVIIETYCHHSLRVVANQGEKAVAKLFFMHRYKLMNIVFQLTFFLHAIYTAMVVMIAGKEVYNHWSHSISWLVLIVAILPPFIAGFVFFPSSFPMFVLASHIGEHVDKKTLEDALKPQTEFSIRLERHQTLDKGTEINLVEVTSANRDRLMSFNVKS